MLTQGSKQNVCFIFSQRVSVSLELEWGKTCNSHDMSIGTVCFQMRWVPSFSTSNQPVEDFLSYG